MEEMRKDVIQTFAWNSPTKELFIAAMKEFDIIAENDPYHMIKRACFISAVKKYHPSLFENLAEDVSGETIDLDAFLDEDIGRKMVLLSTGKKDLHVTYALMDCLWICYFASGMKVYANRVMAINDPLGANLNSYNSIIKHQGLVPLD